MDINDQAKSLQKSLAEIDNKTTKVPEGFMGLVLLRLGSIKLTMRQEHNHNLPHLHIRYKKIDEGSYSVENGNRLAGNGHRKYEKVISAWILKNKSDLLKIWNHLKEGDEKTAKHIIATLKEEN